MARPPYTTGFRKGRVPRKHKRVMLVLLTGARNLSGYPICRMAQAGPETVYPLLYQMEDLGWVTGEWDTEETPDGGRRRYYYLTPEGRSNVTRLLGLGEDGNHG